MPAPEVIAVASEPGIVMGLDNIETNGLPPSPATNSFKPAIPASPFGHGWIPLSIWTRRAGATDVERGTATGALWFRITTPGGVCRLKTGSRLASWNGVGVWLGFAPQLIRGELHLHALDAEKTLTPLVEPARHRALPGRTIVLDPGHGGSDGGTRDARHNLEKGYALDWALRTERLLTNAGWKVILTRRTDTDVSLMERVAIADRARADLFVSLHFNSTAPQTQPAGIETYCLTPAGMNSTLDRGYGDDARSIFPNNTSDTANLAWAYQIHRELVARTQAADGGVKRARFMSVLRQQTRPAVLVEGGFLSNTQEAEKIGSGAYRESLAQALAQALQPPGSP